MQQAELQRRIPTWLTWARVVAIPVIGLLVILPGTWTAILGASLFCAVAITDWLDGYLARRWKVTSAFGAFLDPVADKLLVVVLLILLMLKAPGPVFVTCVLVIVGREIVISALREWMAAMGKSDQVKVSQLGKVKTTLQMLALFFLILGSHDLGSIWFGGVVLLVLAAGLTLISMLEYLRSAAKSLS